MANTRIDLRPTIAEEYDFDVRGTDGVDRVFTLSDAIPSEVMQRTLRLVQHTIEWREATMDETRPDAERAKIAADAVEMATDEVFDIFRLIFLASYHDATDEEMLTWFDHTAREAIVGHFFTLRSTRSSLPSNASTPIEENVVRSRRLAAANRATAPKTSSSRSGATPSSRQMKKALGL
jgi:hypothetical protein